MKKSEFLSENFQFLVVKFSMYLNRRVFIMKNEVKNVVFPLKKKKKKKKKWRKIYPVYQVSLRSICGWRDHISFDLF